jgi:hypothetical protein
MTSIQVARLLSVSNNATLDAVDRGARFGRLRSVTWSELDATTPPGRTSPPVAEVAHKQINGASAHGYNIQVLA